MRFRDGLYVGCYREGVSRARPRLLAMGQRRTPGSKERAFL